MSDRTTTLKLKASGEYYPRRSIRGRIVLVRNTNRRQSMMDRLTSPYMRGVYSGAVGVGAITGMAMMMRRKGNERAISELKKGADASFDYVSGDPTRAGEELDEFGYACGSTFIPDSAKCYTDPKTRARLKTPLTKAQVEKVRSASFSQAIDLPCRKVRIGNLVMTLRHY